MYEYKTFSILDFSNEELGNSANPFAQVILAARMALLEDKVPEDQLLERKIFIAKRLLRKGFQAGKLRAILKFLGNYVLFEDPEMNRIFIEQIYSQDKKHVMGIDEYIKWEAIEEERESFVKNLLRGTDFPDEKIASLANVNLEFVNEVKADLRIK